MLLRVAYDYIKNLLARKEGQAMVEYILLIGLIALAVIAVLIILGPAISNAFQDAVDSVDAL